MDSTQRPAGDPDTARIINLVSSLVLAVDINRYDVAEAALAPELVVDYTNSWGGTPKSMTATAYTDALRRSVPGFDATRHELIEIEAQIDGDEARAAASFDVRHWLDGDLWRLFGTYHWTLRHNAGHWAVTSLRRVVTKETGDRGIVAKAMERAAGR